MRIVDLRCPNCGSSLDINKEESFFNCKNCGSSLYLEMTVKEKKKEEETDPEIQKSFEFFGYMIELIGKCNQMKDSLNKREIYTEQPKLNPSDEVIASDYCYYDEKTVASIEYPTNLNNEQKKLIKYGLTFFKVERGGPGIIKMGFLRDGHFRPDEDVCISDYCYYVSKAADYAKALTTYVEVYNAYKRIENGTFDVDDIETRKNHYGPGFYKEQMKEIKTRVTDYETKAFLGTLKSSAIVEEGVKKV